ncbi:MAG: preprotein translocase subunit SecG [Ignavibacteria bacterium]|nr:MAG: preprotein translocase subunit SecG [Ignavibacteria bacterium]
MFTVLMLIIILISILITVTILMQNPKGGGLSSAFGGASGGMGSMLGVRHASDILAKTTWGLAITLTILIFAVNMFFLPSEGTQESIIQRNAAEAPLSPVEKQQQMQQQPAPDQQQAPAGTGEQAPPPPPPTDN